MPENRSLTYGQLQQAIDYIHAHLNSNIETLMNESHVIPVLRSPQDYRAYRNFAELIRSGIPVELDAEDLAVLRREPALP